jgi:xanthosine utilization system XapX-like protein
MVIMKILYKPFAIIAGLISARLGQRVFQKLWAKIDEEPAPVPSTRAASTPKVVASAALQAATFAGVAAFVDRHTLRGFHYLTGAWPEKKPKRDKKAEKAAPDEPAGSR